MPGIPYKDVVKVLLDRFPEFRETREYQSSYPDIAYDVWGGFGRFATTYMRRSPAERLVDDPFVDRVFDLANELMDSDDPETHSIVVIELLENFHAYRKTLELARRKLKKEHLTWLERQGDVSRSADLHFEGELISPRGLDVLARLFKQCSWRIEVGWFEPNGTRYIASHDPRIELEMEPSKGPRYAFFGSPWETGKPGVGMARRLLGELSQRLAQGDIVHRITLYRTGLEDVLLDYFHHRWPQGQEEIQGWFPPP